MSTSKPHAKYTTNNKTSFPTKPEKRILHSLISNNDDDDIDDFLKSLDDEEDGEYNFYQVLFR